MKNQLFTIALILLSAACGGKDSSSYLSKGADAGMMAEQEPQAGAEAEISVSQEEPVAEVSSPDGEPELKKEPAAGLDTIGFVKGTGISAFTNKSRAQHAARHLTDAGLLPNWSKATYELFKEMGVRIVENPLAVFEHRLGSTAVAGYHGKVAGNDVVMFVYKEGEYTGLIATSFVPSRQQMIKWGLK